METNYSYSEVETNSTWLPNQTEDNTFGENYTDFSDILNEEGLFEKPFYIACLVICIVGLSANILTIIGTANIPHSLAMHSKLIISLCASDGLILVAYLGHFLTYIESPVLNNFCYFMVKRVLQDTAIFATLLNLLMMTADHYLSIMKPLRYRRFMSNFRSNAFILAIWFISLLSGLLEVIIGKITESDSDVSFCLKISYDDFDNEQMMIIIIFTILVCMIIFFTIIHHVIKKIVKHDQTLYRDNQHNLKATMTLMLIIGTFVLFWSPMACFKIYNMLFPDKNLSAEVMTMANDVITLLLMLNSLADPFIYAIRLTEVQKGFRVMVYRLFPNRRFSINEEEYRNNMFSDRRDTVPTIIQDNRNTPSPDGDKTFEVNNKTEESCFITDRNTYYE